ncbi:30S ribosomal protein S19 (mitochondrion) [Nannochloropsis gaditana]|jgi:small subunit ribosomal protein S19|uniref:30S ribosomal protein S19 n=2 Tax=Monodopsidaceae TaxID=425072 RepID=K9ZVM6_9STRA|nr:30S ribosomal protein S19 [Nannochloropsis gaditana]YP_008519375.1 30S ribosomal protein S19 [Microchloropsis salina]AFZ64362.1 30S ribosomal protein S19 [Nannochloropsis gaditana]AGI48954.1 30S ribosomal protein S19 [Microchloropsis salina]AGI49060.1 30S ribosomal protein S19 [Nannochloropsis gaditana]AHX24916.1 30S ribosomal protein S19 [Nannochloropsis gaditana]AHX25037.1 30S ribosomal protein S19 [Microchloropsis salina]
MNNSKTLPLNLKKIRTLNANLSLKTWSRSSIITDEFFGMRLKVHNGKDFIPLLVIPEMLGYKIGEFVGTRARYQFKKKKKKKTKK